MVGLDAKMDDKLMLGMLLCQNIDVCSAPSICKTST